MKNRFSKLTCLLLCAMMILSMTSFYASSVETASENAYYVIYGGAGDKSGSSVDNAAASVADVIATINADGLGAGDTANVYIMNYVNEEDPTQNYNYYAGGEGAMVGRYVLPGATAVSSNRQEHHMTPWTTTAQRYEVPAHTATLRITSYDDPSTAEADLSYLAFTPLLGENEDMYISGPVIFEDISIVQVRREFRGICTRGHDVTFGEGTLLQHIQNSAGKNADGHSGDGYVYHGDMVFKNSVHNLSLSTVYAYGGKTFPGGTVRPIGYASSSTSSDRGIFFPSAKNAGPYTITTRQNLYIENANMKTNILWGGMLADNTDTYQQGVAIVVNAADALTNSYLATHSDVLIENGFTVVCNNGETFPALPDNVTVKGGEWRMSSADTSGNALDLTETTGTFKVIGGLTAWAEEASGAKYASVDGLLTVPAGTYTVTYTNNAATTGTYYLDGVESGTYVVGGSISLPTLTAKPGKEFVGWSDGTGTYLGLYTAETETTYLTSVFRTLEDTYIVYVSDKGDDTNDGLSEATALQTLNAAISKAEAAAESNKLVVVVGDVTVVKGNGTFPAHTGMITIMGDGTGESRILKGDTFSINGPTTFRDIELCNMIDHKHIDTSSKKLIIGENVTVTAGIKDETTGSKYQGTFNIHVGSINKNGTVRENAEIYSKVNSLYVAAYYNNAQRTYGGADILIGDGGSADIVLQADGFTGNNEACVYDTASVNITVNKGGKVSKVSTGTKAVFTENAGIHFIVNGGSIPSIVDTIPAWIINMDPETTTDTQYITGGTTKGVFNVVGDKTALAESSTGAQFVSVDGVLTIPTAGTYTVSFVDEVFYIFDGEKAEFYQDFTLDYATLEPNKKDGKLFIGWTFEDGTVPTNTSFKKGDVIVANYADIDLDTDFFIEGAEIRTTDPQGLRFVIKKTDALDALPEIESFGSVVLPSYYLRDYTNLVELELELDKQYTYEGTKYTPAEVEAVNIYEQADDYVRYTVCITDITEEYYERMFTVRGYIRYTDLNGNDNILYTDYYATRNVNVAEAILRDPNANLSEEQTAYYQGIIDSVKGKIRADYSGEKIDKSGYETPDANSFKNVYEISGNGIHVREVNIYANDYVEGVTDREPVEIIQTSDIHFNYTNAADFEEANPSIMSTYEYRTWLKGGKSVPNAINVLRYAYQADAMIITGDIVDFISLGCMELTNKYLFDVYPFAMACVGNHDTTRVCQGKVSDPTTAESRYELLQQNWNNESVYYASRVIKDRVMMINLDNGQNKFWDSQVPLLAADLATAKEKGYTVLIFYHIPLRTGNPGETAVEGLPDTKSGMSDSSGARNFVSEGVSPTTNTATTEIYQLLRDNADVIKGMFCGHTHTPYYSEFVAETDGDGNPTKVIPQYTMTAAAYGNGSATKIYVY